MTLLSGYQKFSHWDPHVTAINLPNLFCFWKGGGLIQFLCIYVLAPWASLPLTPDNNCLYRTIYSYPYFVRSTGDSYKTNKNIHITISLRKNLVRLHLIFIHLRLIKTQRFVWTDLRFGGSREEHHTCDSYKTNKKENVIYTCYYLPSQRLGPTSPHLYSSPVDKDAAFCLDRLTILYLRFGGSREEHLQRT